MKKVVLADCPNGRVVRVDGRWGVVCKGAIRRHKAVDFWDGGREAVSDTDIVETAPALRVLVGGVVEEPEEIAA